MLSLYKSPLRVYLLLGVLAVWGILSGLGLSVSLFPMSSQVTVSVNVSYGSYSSQQFYESVGRKLETMLHGVKSGEVPLDSLKAEYRDRNVRYLAKFDWGAEPDESVKTIETKVISFLAGYDKEIRDSLQVHAWREGGSFLALSFYSPLRSLDEIYQVLEPLMTPIKSSVPDADNFGLWNPEQKEITVRLMPEKLARYELSTRQVQNALSDSIFAYNGGTLKIGEKDYQISLPKKAGSVDSLLNVRVSPVGQEAVLLKDVAEVEVGLQQESMMRFKTSGVESLILFASPKEGGNIKRMADDVMAGVEASKPQWPADIQYKVLVNPAEFINKSVNGVVREVAMAAFLAVGVLFFFIGSFRNVCTAAIEIPLSLLMAFIMMKLAGMNLNLISLGGLALSAGMNVDASVVVLENILRHFEGKRHDLSYDERAAIVVEAVNEVKLPVIASTLASLVVFAPLVFTRGLTNSLLGDLAKAVLFSHGLSAIVALVLVPTIRLQLLSKGEVKHTESRFEPYIAAVEQFYGRSLRAFLASVRAQAGALIAVAVILPLLVFLVVPRLQKEVIGKPESDWLDAGVHSPLITTAKQNEAEFDTLEASLIKDLGDEVLYTFTEIQGAWGGDVMVRLKHREKAQEIIAKTEESYKNTPTKSYWVDSWTPSELEIPDPPDFRVEVKGGTPLRRQQVGHDLDEILRDPDLFGKVRSTPSNEIQKGLLVSPLPYLVSQPEVMSRIDLSHFLRVATDGVLVDSVVEKNVTLPLYLRMPKEISTSLERLEALPVGFDHRLVPVGALARISIQEKDPPVYRENEQAMTVLDGRVNKAVKSETATRITKARAAVEEYRGHLATADTAARKDNPIVTIAQADKELTDALDQLKWAVLISIALIFITMVLQLGDIVHSLLVLVAIPLGLIGVVVSLWVFRSSLSLNSGLGTILLNGIAVANSIILVDFIRKKHSQGMAPFDAVISASTARLRPILMTSLCTVLGMFPIALGLGEGGKTLQPLGIAVCGGLWISMSLTLFLVPSLQYQYLRFKFRRHAPAGASKRSHLSEVQL
ncbi:MAG: efflux RND transporter permease subunit [Bdellovibrionota bacterium]